MRRRGQLTVFLGYAIGVGKTCAMLEAARKKKREGVDVVVGCLETHGRANSEALAADLERIPYKQTVHRDLTLCEFDLDAALARKPQLLLMDELAHTNATTSPHEKRYQDVDALLDAGIDVYATLNAQHIESLCDAASAITGQIVTERIPDEWLTRADRVELVDAEPKALLERLHRGEICEKGQIRHAASHYFTPANLEALRRIAAEYCADRANLLHAAAFGQDGVREHVLVCLSPSPSSVRNIRTAARMAVAFGAQFTALYVQVPGAQDLPETDLERLQANRRLAGKLGATVETVFGEDVPFQISEYARLSGVTHVVLGRNAAVHRHPWSKPTLTDRLISYSPELDIHIIPDSSRQRLLRPDSQLTKRSVFSPADFMKSLGMLVLATGLSIVFYHLGFSESNIILAYILGVVITSVITERKAYSLVSSIASVVIYNFLFTEPRFTLQAYGSGYPVTFLVMFLTAFITSTLAARLKNHAKQSAGTAYRTKILFDANQGLSQSVGREAIFKETAKQLSKLLERDIVVYPCQGAELGKPLARPIQENEDISALLSPGEQAVAFWVMKNNKHAGATTNTLSGAQCLYLAIRVNAQVYGVAGISVGKRPLDTFEQSILLSILGECALALENEKNAREKEEAAVLARNEQLRANLLRAISHDLRTPLTSISGNASNLLSNSAGFEEETKLRIYADIYNDALWLINLVENLLSITRIEDGRMSLRLSAELIDEVIDEALAHVSRRAAEHPIRVHNEEELMLAHIDARLIVQVIINLIDNAVKYTPPSSHIDLYAEQRDGWIVMRVADDGPGIPDEVKPYVFDMFYTGANRVSDSRRSLGLGLGLCKAIITAHGGEISVYDNAPHGAVFQFTLPKEEVTLHE